MMSHPNVLFFFIDCLRADACYGDHRYVRTPTLDRLRQRGTAFTQAISVAGNTPVCLSSLFTGVYPPAHGVRPLSLNRLHLSTHKVDAVLPTLAEILKAAGYHTRASVTGPLLHVTGLDRGFERYDWRTGEDVYLRGRFGKQLRSLIENFSGLSAPWFLFVHLWELHAPRQVSPGFNTAAYGRNRYERSLSSLDLDLNEILSAVNLDDTIVVIHGDHGEGTESLFEFLLHPRLHDAVGVKAMRIFYSLFFKWIHQYRRLQSAHGLNLYDDLLRVPLTMAGSAIPAGQTVDLQVSQVDILPTLLDLAGLPSRMTRSIHGRSLLPLVEGGDMQERPVYAEAYSGKSVSPRYLPTKWIKPGKFPRPPALVAIRTSEWKCIWVPEDPRIRTELYDLRRDPGEKDDVADRYPEIVTRLKAELTSVESDHESPGVRLSAEEEAMIEKRLRELGYL